MRGCEATGTMMADEFPGCGGISVPQLSQATAKRSAKKMIDILEMAPCFNCSGRDLILIV
jgi:hypothetical protein